MLSADEAKRHRLVHLLWDCIWHKKVRAQTRYHTCYVSWGKRLTRMYIRQAVADCQFLYLLKIFRILIHSYKVLKYRTCSHVFAKELKLALYLPNRFKNSTTAALQTLKCGKTCTLISILSCDQVNIPFSVFHLSSLDKPTQIGPR